MPSKRVWIAALGLAGIAVAGVALYAWRHQLQETDNGSGELSRKARTPATSIQNLSPGVQKGYYEGRLRNARNSERRIAQSLEQAREARRQLNADADAPARAELESRIKTLERLLKRAHERTELAKTKLENVAPE